MILLEDRVRAVVARADRKVAPGDTMYHGNDAHYFGVGASALKALLLALETAGRPEPRRVLDFGCGFGRVMRALRAAFPGAELLACDVDAGGVAYCVEAFGARAVAGSTDLAAMDPPTEVDLIWCGSVLTHLDADQWPRLLAYFARALSDGGVAVMTTHGRQTAWRMEHVADYGLEPIDRGSLLESYRSTGFGYRDQGQPGYGISVSSPAWAVGQVGRVPELRTIGYVEAGWDGHQDVLAVAKDAARWLNPRG
jgi:SAM-dependent methyltransferase